MHITISKTDYEKILSRLITNTLEFNITYIARLEFNNTRDFKALLDILHNDGIPHTYSGTETK